MILYVTSKLAEKLKISPKPNIFEVDSFYSWRAHYVQEHGYRFVVFMNDATRYTIVINEAKADKLKKIEKLFFHILRETFGVMGINPEVISRYINELGNIYYAKNSDKKKTAQLNKNVNDTWWLLRDITDDVELSVECNRMVYNTSGSDEVLIPNEKMLELLKRYGLPIRKCRAFDLNVRLDLDGRDAIRKIRVPADITFEQLHKILQTAFGWLSYHLYCFGLFNKWSKNYYAKPDIELVMSEEDYAVNPNAIIMAGIKLSDYIPEYGKILYTYDFGDDWHHYIELDDIIEDCEDDLPKLLYGEGDAPPEDVGGSGGFADFLEIISDPNNYEYEHTISWVKSVRWKPFDFDTIAWRINRNYKNVDNTIVENTILPADKAEDNVYESDVLENIKHYILSKQDKWGFVIGEEPFSICESCGNPATVCIDDNNANKIGILCERCYNKIMADITGSNIPEIVPKQISITGRNGKIHEFDLRFYVFVNGMLLTATEIGKLKRRADIRGELDDDFYELLETLKLRLKKAISVKYMDKNGYIKDDKAIGYIDYSGDRSTCDVVIDGKPYTWEQLEKSVTMREGWKVKIKFACAGDELE